MCKNSLFLLFSFILGLSLVSCNNFLKADEVKDDIEQHIAYANAESYLIKVTSQEGTGNIAKPASGETYKKVTDTFDIRFEALPDYEFVSWQASSSKLSENQDISDYIEIEDIQKSETSVKFKKALEDIVITATVAERPYIISKTPLYSATRSLRDATIQVMFDRDMDELSIYFDTNEIQKIKDQYNLADDAFEYINPAQKEKCWCYKYDGKTYFKNISIINQKSNQNINDCFNAPVINKNILTITANSKNPPASFSQILVTIEKDFFYKVGAKNISMGRSEKWNYQVNDKTDKNPPVVNSCEVGFGQNINEDNEYEGLNNKILPCNACPQASQLRFVNGNKLYFDLEITDDDGTIPSMFDLIIQRVKDSEYTPLTNTSKQTINVEYLSAGGKEGKFYGPAELGTMDDGVYSLYLKFTDASNHSCTYPATAENAVEPENKFYFCLDNTIPEPVLSYTSTKDTITLSDTSVPSDFKQAAIRYKEKNAANYTAISSPVTSYPFSIDNLPSSSDYEIEVTSEDNAGNKAVKKIIALTSTPAPVLVKPADNYNTLNSMKITWDTVPVDMNKFIITAGNKTVELSDLTYTESEGKRSYSYTINNLKATTKYPVKVQTVKYRSDGSVEKPESEEKTYCTAPATVIVGEAKPSWDQEKQEWSIAFELGELSQDATYSFFDSFHNNYEPMSSSSRIPKFSLGTFEGGPIQYMFKTQITDDWDLEDTVETETGTCQIYPYVVLKNIRESAGKSCVCEWTLEGRAGADPYYSYIFYVNNSSITPTVLSKPDNSGYYANVPIGWNKGSGDDIYMEWYFVNEGESTLIGRQKFVFENDFCTYSKSVTIQRRDFVGNSLKIQWLYNPSDAKSIIIRVYKNNNLIGDMIEINPGDYMHGYTIEDFKSIYGRGTYTIKVTTKNNLDVENTDCVPISVTVN